MYSIPPQSRWFIISKVWIATKVYYQQVEWKQMNDEDNKI